MHRYVVAPAASGGGKRNMQICFADKVFYGDEGFYGSEVDYGDQWQWGHGEVRCKTPAHRQPPGTLNAVLDWAAQDPRMLAALAPVMYRRIVRAAVPDLHGRPLGVWSDYSGLGGAEFALQRFGLLCSHWVTSQRCGCTALATSTLVAEKCCSPNRLRMVLHTCLETSVVRSQPEWLFACALCRGGLGER